MRHHTPGTTATQHVEHAILLEDQRSYAVLQAWPLGAEGPTLPIVRRSNRWDMLYVPSLNTTILLTRPLSSYLQYESLR